MIIIPMVLSIQIDWNIYAAFKSLCSVDLWANNHLRFAATFHRDEEHSVIPACIILKMNYEQRQGNVSIPLEEWYSELGWESDVSTRCHSSDSLTFPGNSECD